MHCHQFRALVDVLAVNHSAWHAARACSRAADALVLDDTAAKASLRMARKKLTMMKNTTNTNAAKNCGCEAGGW